VYGLFNYCLGTLPELLSYIVVIEIADLGLTAFSEAGRLVEVAVPGCAGRVVVHGADCVQVVFLEFVIVGFLVQVIDIYSSNILSVTSLGCLSSFFGSMAFYNVGKGYTFLVVLLGILVVVCI
jgi:hypothetical protein